MKIIKNILLVILPLIQSHVYALDSGEIYKKSIESVVTVVSLDKDNKILMTGTGFFAKHKNLIATNYHVIKNTHHLKIITSDDKEHNIFDICVENASNDIAILRSIPERQPLSLNKNTPSIGDKIISIGSPMGLSGSLSTGVIGAIRKNEGHKYYQITSPISPGSSGGPVIDENGLVLGMTTFYIKGAQNLNFAIPSPRISTYLNTSMECLKKSNTQPDTALINKYSESLYENYLKNKDSYPSERQNIKPDAYQCIAQLISDFGTKEEIIALNNMFINKSKSLDVQLSPYRKNILKSLINNSSNNECLATKKSNN
ncbi:MAG: serine protease [Gammaproteobacteria bacterium]|nr:serine protease [Gammaproteobacteria bacterium]MCF6260445.1 serine protease [Gammaproteobacteria bacterium]